MIYRLILGFIIVSFQVLYAQNEFNPNDRLEELSGKKHNIGLAAGYSVDGKIIWSNSEGYACKKGKVEFSTTTLTRTASIAKSFTAVAVMQLVEKGKLDLDKPIKHYLSDLPEHKENITLRQLLGHTAAISQYYGKKEFESKVYYPTLEEAMDVFINRRPKFTTGSTFRYTSYGYVVIGRIIEEVTQMTYEDYMDKYIFTVAEMTNTGVENSNTNYVNKSCLYHKKRKKAKLATTVDLSNRVPGGGLYSTLEDVLKFGNAVLDGRLISDTSLELMKEYQPVDYNGNKYGLGWYLYGSSPNEGDVIGHSGGQAGCTSQLLIVPETKTVVVVLSNTSNNYEEIFSFASDLIKLSENE